jgi:hypothetical protein
MLWYGTSTEEQRQTEVATLYGRSSLRGIVRYKPRSGTDGVCALGVSGTTGEGCSESLKLPWS